jgi:hypothetical protein
MSNFLPSRWRIRALLADARSLVLTFPLRIFARASVSMVRHRSGSYTSSTGQFSD